MEAWERIFILVLVIVLFLKFTPKEGFYGWIPISTRNTYNMSYDLRGDPIFYHKHIWTTPLSKDSKKSYSN